MRVLWIFFVTPVLASACECYFPPVCERVRTTPIVFWGETVDGGLDPGEDAWSGRPNSANLKDVEAFRGVTQGAEIEIELFFQKGMCSPIPYRRGARTLVFLHSDPEGDFHERACTASFESGDGARELELVRRYFARAPTTIAGTVRRDDAPYMAVERARVFFAPRDGGACHSVLTSPDGSFEIIGLAPGAYRLWATKRGYEARGDSSAFVELKEFGCAIADLSLWTKGKSR